MGSDSNNKKQLILLILEILRTYSDLNHKLSMKDIVRHMKMEYAFKFCCEITLQDRVQEVILYYHRKMELWTMEKIRE